MSREYDQKPAKAVRRDTRTAERAKRNKILKEIRAMGVAAYNGVSHVMPGMVKFRIRGRTI